MRLRQYDPLERELRRPHWFIRYDNAGNARMSVGAYLPCAATAALVFAVGLWAIGLLTN